MGQQTSCRQHPGNLVAPPSPVPSPNEMAPQAAAASRMCFAACEGDDAAIQKLLAKGVSVNVSDYDRRTALHIAAAEGHLSTVQLLISAGADVMAKDRWGHTPMDEAQDSAHEDIKAALRVAGADNGDTPCGQHGQHGPMVPKSVMSDTDSTPPGGPGGGRELTDIDSSLPLSTGGETIADEANLQAGMRMCCAAAAGNVRIIREMVAAGIPINASDYDGRSALHVAAAYGHTGLARELLSLRADVNRKDHFGSSALSAAVSHNQEEVAALLLKARQDTGDSPFASMETLEVQQDVPLPGLVSGLAGRDCSLANWIIQEKEVQFGPVLSTTLKSAIHVAEWRGIKVVAKTLLKRRMSQTSASGEDGVETKEVLHEIGLLSTMRHPDLVMFLGACLSGPRPFFITEFMDGGDLERYYIQKTCQLGRRYKPDMSLFLKWSSAVARALCFLHNCSAPVIHRDLKPLNLLLTKNQDLKVTDFGISKLMWPMSDHSGDRAPRMSGGVGTWRYMAPEVVRAEQYTDRVDVYSFSLIMWFMSSGLQPFEEQFGKDAELVLKDYLRGNEPRPTFGSHVGILSGSKGTPAALRHLVEDCWHRHAASRPSAHQCTQRLAEIAAQAEQGTWSARAGKVAGIIRQRS